MREVHTGVAIRPNALSAMCHYGKGKARPSIRRHGGAGNEPCTAGNGGSIALPTVLPPSVRDSLLTTNGDSSFDTLGQKFGVQNGRLDFFSLRSDDSGDFKPLLRGGVGEGGLKLQLKW